MPHTPAFDRLVSRFCIAACAGVLAACGGGGQAGIGGAVSGLSSGASLTLQNNNSDSLTVSANQSFTFPTQLDAGDDYSVSVLVHPVGHTCTVSNGSGTVDSNGTDVSDVTVACSVTSSIGGTLSGLAAGNSVSLTTNGQVLPLAVNGAFAFNGLLAAGTSYNVTVSQQPAQQTCVVANPGGTVVSGVMVSLVVTCQ